MATILVVDDELGIRALLSDILTDEGHSVELAENAAQARTMRERCKPDLVLLDWMLPGTSGLNLAKRWRGQQRTKDLPVIMLTARAEETDKVAGLDAGADDYIAKPIDVDRLVSLCRVWMGR